MKIIHILNTGGYSGAENIVISLIKKMSKLSHECIYVSPSGIINEKLKEENIKHIKVKTNKIKELAKIIKEEKPDIIHAHDFSASIKAALTFKNVPIISHIHCNPLWLKKINLKSVFYLFSTIKYKQILIVSPAIKKEYIFSKLISKKIVTVKNFVDEESIIKKSKESVSDTKKYDIIFLGRLIKEKNPKRFIKLIKKISETNRDVQVAIVGDGYLKNEVIELIKEHKLENNIKLLGFQANPYPILKNSKLLCMTSDVEGYGLVAVEALVLNKPVVASNVGGIPTIIDETCGKICNNDTEYIEEILKLLNNTKYYNLKSKNASKRLFKVNNVDDYIKNLNAIYESNKKEVIK